MKFSTILLVLATISLTLSQYTDGYIKSYLQVNNLQSTIPVGTYEKSRWSPEQSSAAELICDSTEYLVGGADFGYGVEVTTNRHLQKHYKVQVTATLYFFDFAAEDDLTIKIDNNQVAQITSLDFTADIPSCTEGGTAHSATNINTYNLDVTLDSHTYSSLDFQFLQGNSGDVDSNGKWAINLLKVCSMAYDTGSVEGTWDCTVTEGPNTTDLSCPVDEIVYEDECSTTADALTCYQALNTLRGDATATTKFTRASTIEQDDMDDNTTQRIQVVWTFTDFAHSDCVNYEVTFDKNRIPKGSTAGAQNEWFRDGTTSIEYSVPTSYIRDNCDSADFDAQYTQYTCEFSLAIIENFTVQYKENLSLKLKVQKLNTEIAADVDLVVESEDTDASTDCCENTLDIVTELVLCTGSDCDNPVQTSAEDPFIIKKDQVVYFQHRMVNPGIYSTYYLNLKTFSVGFFAPPIVENTVQNELTKTTWQYYPGLAGSSLEFKVISVISDTQDSTASGVTNPTEAAPVRRILEGENLVGDDYKVLGVAYITIQDESEADGNYDIVQKEGGDKISNNKEIVKEDENNSDSNLLIAVIIGVGAFVLFSVIGTILYLRSINKNQKKQQKSKKEKYEQKQSVSDIEINDKDYSNIQLQNPTN